MHLVLKVKSMKGCWHDVYCNTTHGDLQRLRLRFYDTRDNLLQNHVVVPCANQFIDFLCHRKYWHWSQLLETIPLPNIKWICPTAPTRPMSIFGGFPSTAWFDVEELSEAAPDDLEGLDASAAHVANLLSTEPADIKLGVGGFSMGAATALYSASCFTAGKYGNGNAYPANISAAVGLSGWLPCSKTLSNKLQGVDDATRRAQSFPILMCHGKDSIKRQPYPVLTWWTHCPLIDAQLCSVIKSTLHLDIKPIFCPHITCESVWSQAKKLYTNETQRLYGVCHKLMNIITPKKIEGSISTYHGNVHSALHDFNELLPPAASNTIEQEKEREQCSTFFMLLALYGLLEEYFAICDQILGSATIPDMSTTSAILLRVPVKHSLEPTITPAPSDTAALASFGNNKNRYRGGPSNSKPRSNSKCAHCDQSGHDIDNCWVLHGKPPRRRVNMTQANQTCTIQTKPSPKGSLASYEDFLRWCQSNHNSSSIASIAHCKKQNVVARSSAEAEYRAMALVTCDEVVPFKFGEKSSKCLSANGFQDVTFKAYNGLGHYTIPEETDDVCAWLTSKLGLEGNAA
ncbi:hypothetical protein TSUD_403220 [Trifolium subterraneum]|uniref:Phospholipase/carboxylesterase/thioesterase domain-containing protein n=1 Tax=Trifolium subterraneum TaxID=3900 RepID=A0A2Z6PCJ7_TRISU|nr:hypothetical protein TSUD_403220 [Trifolium subterraneum]